MTWKDDAAQGWELLSWNGQAQWFAKMEDGRRIGGRLYSLDSLIRSIENNPRWDWYLNLNPTRARSMFATRNDVTRWRYACLDLDLSGDTTPEPKEEPSVPALWDVAACVFTGRGYQYWLPIYDMPEPPDWAEEAMRLLLRSTEVAGWKVDPCTSDLPRRVRCPGSVNQRSGQRARVVRMPAGGWEPIEPERKPIQLVDGPEVTGTTSLSDILPHLNVRNLKAYNFVLSGQEHPGRRAALYTFIKTMSEMGIDAERAKRWSMIGAEKCRPYERDPNFWPKEIRRVVRQVYGRSY